MDSFVGALYCSFSLAHIKVNGRENDEWICWCYWFTCSYICWCAWLYARACARLGLCLYVFACLSHDVLWQLLTNRTGASGRWWGGGERQAWDDAERGRSATEPRRGVPWLTAVTWWEYNEAKLHSDCWITEQMTHDLTYYCANTVLQFSLVYQKIYFLSEQKV